MSKIPCVVFIFFSHVNEGTMLIMRAPSEIIFMNPFGKLHKRLNECKSISFVCILVHSFLMILQMKEVPLSITTDTGIFNIVQTNSCAHVLEPVCTKHCRYNYFFLSCPISCFIWTISVLYFQFNSGAFYCNHLVKQWNKGPALRG